MKSVTIYLGSKCNMNCAYCHREPDPEETKGLPPEFYQRLRIMAREGPLTGKFMGGEPTLYMDTIKKVVAAVPGATFAIATNGKNLETFLPFFRAHYFKIALSYDGGDVDLRGFNPLEKLVDYPYLSISTTIFHGNTDFRKILAQFREKREKGMKISFFPHLVHHTSPANAAYALTKEDYASVLRNWEHQLGTDSPVLWPVPPTGSQLPVWRNILLQPEPVEGGSYGKAVQLLLHPGCSSGPGKLAGTAGCPPGLPVP